MLKVNDLLISADGTYPGIVTKALSPRDVMVKWYKWGYDSPDFYHDNERTTDMLPFLATPADIRKKFWTLPPEYNPEIVTTGEKIEQLKKLAADIANATYLVNEENYDGSIVDEAEAALVKFYLERE